MSGGSGYIGTFDNTGDWEITFKGKLSSGQCGFWIIKSDETSRDTNDILLNNGSVYVHTNGANTSQSGFGMSYNTWYDVKYVKNGTSITVTANGVSKTITWSLATSLSTLSIGVDAWGGTATIKDIIVKPL